MYSYSYIKIYYSEHDKSLIYTTEKTVSERYGCEKKLKKEKKESSVNMKCASIKMVLWIELVQSFSTFTGTTFTRDFSIFNGKFVVVCKLFTCDNSIEKNNEVFCYMYNG